MSSSSLLRIASYALAYVLVLSGPYAIGQEKTPVSTLPELKVTDSGVEVLRTKESFSNLSLEGSDLVPQPPLLGERVETAEYTRELWEVKWRANDPIHLYVIRPRGVKNPPVVLYLYGFPGETTRFRDDQFCKRVVKNGAAAVGFVSAYTGQRTDRHPPSKWFVSELPESLASTVHDVTMILNWMDSRGDFDMSRVGMFGHGSGGAIAILAASVDHRLKAVDLLDPWGDWPNWLALAALVPADERLKLLKPEFLKQVEPLEPTNYLRQLNNVIVRIQFQDDDGNMPKFSINKLESAAPQGTVITHYANREALLSASSGGRLFEWIAGQLGAKPATRSAKMETALPADVKHLEDH